MEKTLVKFFLFLLCLSLPGFVFALPTTYSDESSFLSAVAEYDTVFESFESSAWIGTGSGVPGTITNFGFTWDASGLLATSFSHPRTGGLGIFDMWSDPPGTDVISVTSADGLLYGVGGWFSNLWCDPVIIFIDGTLVGTLTFSTTPPLIHQFFGVVDTAGFGSVTFSSSGNFGADDFTFASAPVPEPATMFLLSTGLLGLAGIGRKKLKNKDL